MTGYRSKLLQKKAVLGIALGMLVAALTLGGAAWAKAPLIQFGVPTWPGVTVQSEVAAQLLEVMGYDTKQTSASPAFSLNSIASDQLDVYLGGWMPTEASMINPLKEKGEVEVMATNISGAIMGLAVPTYVWDAGVKTVDDLNKHADQFESKIYAIEPGTGFNTAIQEAIDNNDHDLGDWTMVASSTSSMLVQVERMVDREEWITFLGWEPHWMNITYDMKYLEPVGEPKIAGTTSDVLTVANPKTVADNPELARFLTQFQVQKDTMSEWILEFGYKERRADEVASEWIGANLDKVAVWLDGVKTLDGEPAIDAVRAAYQD
ncbi:MAG TPA: ABC transporter substrate-binding protein [Salinisphaeraceae bacterium]|nr:ABC transporter substrate-binding protein [Salinisphaeraceae bacterium]